ncbi:hypothetical protein FA13DRAFT_1744117 [Coprinellus micaceus]|uniref:Uncharacterized protein n=1 Tax=Coprinellus micaceus TaxID=71717 RepID=A0A4Y7SDA1_COPMI|nr:hypothetical protein FA13DRAFT_1744117 [Coprinellus micaceus]
MPRDTSLRMNKIDAELEALDEKGRALLDMLNRSTVLQGQHGAQRKEIESQRSQLAKQKQIRKREKEKREREQKEATEREQQQQKQGQRRGPGKRFSAGVASVWEITETWELVPESYSCPRCMDNDSNCYRLVTSFGGKARAGSASETPNPVRCRACRRAKTKCQPPPNESPASLSTLAGPSSAAPVETPVQQTRKRPIDQEEQDTSPVSEGAKRQRIEPKIRADDSTLNKLEILFTDLVKHQEATLSIQRQILQTISSSRPPKVLESYEKEEETDELEYTDGE